MCIKPIKKNFRVENGKTIIDWKSSPIFDAPDVITLRCGHCHECRRAHSYEWALRCALESEQHIHNCMVTLTYDNEHNDNELHKRDLQLFLKRLRKHIFPSKVRYFGCGEYGSKGGRPHYHLCLFGWRPDDLEYFFTSPKSGEKIYTSEILSKIWGNGYVSVGELTMQGALYSSLYMQKYNRVSDKETKPFLVMSRRPGIANNWLDNIDYQTDSIIFRGRSYPVPRFFDKKLLDNNLPLKQVVKVNRLGRAMIKSLPFAKDYECYCEKLEQEMKYLSY